MTPKCPNKECISFDSSSNTCYQCGYANGWIKGEQEITHLRFIIEDMADTILAGDYEDNARDLAIEAKLKAREDV